MQKIYTFKGGCAVDEYKNTLKMPAEKLPVPETLVLPMLQHIGTSCVPVVKPGDRVLKGQLIGSAEGLASPVHAPASGTVTEIKTVTLTGKKTSEAVVIKCDGTDDTDPSIKPFEKSIADTGAEEIIEAVRMAGIAGTGSSGFPAYAKIRYALGKVKRLIIDATECQPFVTAVHRLAIESPGDIVSGVKILMRALGLPKAEIAAEASRPDAVNSLYRAIGRDSYIKVKIVESKYPQGDERQLVYALTGKEIPSGMLPADMGFGVFKAETCAAIFKALATGMPMTERCITVDGDCIKNPKNLLVPLGTSYRTLIDYCGGTVKKPYVITDGGPLTGTAVDDMDAPVTKGTGAVIVLSGGFCKSRGSAACIRCGRCVNSCPVRLMPNYLADYAAAGKYEKAVKMGIMNCTECGICSYGCPGGVPIVQYIRAAKAVIREKNAADRDPSK